MVTAVSEFVMHEPKKHSVRFNAVGDDPVTSNVYLNKGPLTALLTAEGKTAWPKKIRVTVEVVEW